MVEERSKSVEEFLLKELKWTDKLNFSTRWSQERNIRWVTLDDEFVAKAIFRRLAEVKNNRVRLIKYTPP